MPTEFAQKVQIVDAQGDLVGVTGGALETTGGGGGGGGAVTVADGADVTQGAIADASVADGAVGTLSAKLRNLTGNAGSIVTKLAGGLPAALGAGGGLKIDGSGTALPVSGTVTATPTGTQAVSVADGSDVNAGAIADASVTAGATGSISAKLRRISADIGGILTAITGTLAVKEVKSATGTTSQVSDSASSVTLLASNANRLGATIVNTSTVNLYAKCGTTATTSDFTVLIPASGGYWEVPFGYTGRIDGIWASDPNTGAAAVTEFTA